MKKWSEIKQGIVTKLFMNPDEATDDYADTFVYYANECLVNIANGVKPRIAMLEVTTREDNVEQDMPEDFLSFADMINYWNGIPDPTIIYFGGKLILPKAGTYKIFYNALWEPITEDYTSDQAELPIDQSVLNCIPPYVAAQIMSEDDVQKATMLNNEYELMLSRLDTNIMYQSNSFKSTGGWY
jgi:hypothetical protein